MGDKARDLGKAVGAVSTVWVSHATPGAWYAHNDDRNNGYAIADEGFLGDPNTTGSYSGGHGPTLAPAEVIIGARVESYINSAIRLTFRTLEFLFEPIGVEALAGSLAPKTA